MSGASSTDETDITDGEILIIANRDFTEKNQIYRQDAKNAKKSKNQTHAPTAQQPGR